MIDSDGGDDRAGTLAAVRPSWAPIRLVWDEVVDGEVERLLRPLGDGVVRSVRAFTDVLRTSGPARDAAAHVDRIAELEKARAVIAAAQLSEELLFARQQRAEQLAVGVKAANLGRGVAEQVGFARRVSPATAARHIGLAAVLAERLPQAWRLLQAGEVSEDQCRIVATRTSHLSDADALLVDAGISPRMSGWNRRQTERAVDRAAYEIDPAGSVARRAAAEKDRRVWMSPAPDCMAKVTALLPVAQGVAVFAALTTTANTVKGVGVEKRTRGQIMADELVTRVTGQDQAHLVPVQVNVTISADALFNNGVEPAHLDGLGPIPAELARSIIAGDIPAKDHPTNSPRPPRRAAASPNGKLLTPTRNQR